MRSDHCDRPECDETDLHEVVHFNPNMVQPTPRGVRQYRYCMPHALDFVTPESAR